MRLQPTNGLVGTTGLEEQKTLTVFSTITVVDYCTLFLVTVPSLGMIDGVRIGPDGYVVSSDHRQQDLEVLSRHVLHQHLLPLGPNGSEGSLGRDHFAKQVEQR